MKKFLLWILNKFCNDTPCEYALVNNVENYSRRFLDSTLSQTPKVTLKEFLDDMDRMDKCLKSGESCTIKGGIVYKGDDILIENLQ